MEQARWACTIELLPKNQTIDSNVYCRQLMKLSRKKLLEFGWEVIPHPLYSPDLAPYDYSQVSYRLNVPRPHYSHFFRAFLRASRDSEIVGRQGECGTWNTRDARLEINETWLYHLFRSLQNHLNGKTFNSNKAVKDELIQFFASKNQTFYESGIIKLTERWQKVIEQNGWYIID